MANLVAHVAISGCTVNVPNWGQPEAIGGHKTHPSAKFHVATGIMS
jgi:hypothetical protein